MRPHFTLPASPSNCRSRLRSALPLLWGALALGACAPQGAAQSATDVDCPPGQSYDGTYCVVDQTAPTKETPVAQETGGEASPDAVEPQPTDGTEPSPPPEESDDAGAGREDEGGEGATAGAGAGGVGATQEGADESEDERTEEADSEPSFPDKSTAAPVDYAMAAQAGPVMQYFASSHLPTGSRPLGAPFAGQFSEGQVLVKKVQLKKGSCTTIVGVALPPMTELHLQLVDPEAEVELAADSANGPQAVLGSRNDCFLAETNQSAVVIATAEAGQGVAAVQVFQKQ